MEQSTPKFNFSSSLSNNINGCQDVQTKTMIITRLFNEGHIDFKEATILLKEFILIEKPLEEKDFWFKLDTNPFNIDKTSHYEKCSCNPKNGGSGICGCTLNDNYNIS